MRFMFLFIFSSAKALRLYVRLSHNMERHTANGMTGWQYT